MFSDYEEETFGRAAKTAFCVSKLTISEGRIFKNCGIFFDFDQKKSKFGKHFFNKVDKGAFYVSRGTFCVKIF